MEETTTASLRGRYAEGVREFVAARLSRAELSRTTLADANLSSAELVEANFTEANLTRVDLSEADLTEANFGMANVAWGNLAGAKLPGAHLVGAQLCDANLKGAILTDADLTGANLTMANLTGANLKGANLSMANLTGANLTEANLTWADLKGVNLTRADLTGANLAGPNLTKATLDRANLTRASLKGADLTGANLTHANLSDCDLTDAVLKQAVLVGANLDGTRGIQLDSTYTRDAGFSAWARDPWSQLRRAYSGTLLAFHLLILAAFFLPVAARVAWWRFAGLGADGACALPDCRPYALYEALLGVDRDPRAWALAVVLLTYNLVRALFTWWIGLLKAAEDRSGVSPSWRSYRELSLAHRFVMRPLITVALIYVALRLVDVLRVVVYLPAGLRG